VGISEDEKGWGRGVWAVKKIRTTALESAHSFSQYFYRHI